MNGGASQRTPQPLSDHSDAAPASDLDAAETERRERVRAALIEQARTAFPEIAPLAENGYSVELRERSAIETKFLNDRHQSTVEQVVYLDPARVTAGRALGWTTR